MRLIEERVILVWRILERNKDTPTNTFSHQKVPGGRCLEQLSETLATCEFHTSDLNRVSVPLMPTTKRSCRQSLEAALVVDMHQGPIALKCRVSIVDQD